MRFKALLHLICLILCQFSIFHELSQHIFCRRQFILPQSTHRDTQAFCQVLQVLLAVWIRCCRCRGSGSSSLATPCRSEQRTGIERTKEYTEQQQDRAPTNKENFFHTILRSLSKESSSTLLISIGSQHLCDALIIFLKDQLSVS